MNRGDVVMVLALLSIYGNSINTQEPHVVEEVFPNEGRAIVRPRTGRYLPVRVVMLDELIPWRDGLNWELEHLRMLRRRNEEAMKRLREERRRIDKRIEFIQANDPNQVQFVIMNDQTGARGTRLALITEGGEPLVS